MEVTIKKGNIIVVEQTLKNVISAIHTKQYNKIVEYVNDVTQEEIDIIKECIELQEDIEIDDYGFECDIEDEQVEYYVYDDGSGFAVDYELTSYGDPTNIILELEFIYSKEGLIKRIKGLNI